MFNNYGRVCTKTLLDFAFLTNEKSDANDCTNLNFILN